MAEHNTVEATGFDDDIVAEVVEQAGGKLGDLLERGNTELPSFSPLFEDVFHSLHKFSPRLRDEVPADLRVNQSLMGKAVESPTYERLKARCVSKPDVAALAAMALGEELLKVIPEDAKQKLQEAASQQQEAAEAGEALAGDPLEGLGDVVGQGIEAALAKGIEEADEGEAAASAWGSEPGSLQSVPWRERFDLMQRLRGDAKFKKMAEVLGRFRSIALGKARQTPNIVPSEIVGIKQGRELENLTGESLALLASPVLRPLFWKGYAEASLQVYELQGNEKVGRGPIVVAWDESGSMQGPKELWAKATALALLAVARKQKRHWYGIRFGSSHELEVVEAGPSMAEAEYIALAMKVASQFYAGGTAFEPALQAALEAIESRPELRQADLVFITDGDGPVSQEFLVHFKERQQALGFDVIGVQCGGRPGRLVDFSDSVLPVIPGGVSEEDARQVFERVA